MKMDCPILIEIYKENINLEMATVIYITDALKHQERECTMTIINYDIMSRKFNEQNKINKQRNRNKQTKVFFKKQLVSLC